MEATLSAKGTTRCSENLPSSTERTVLREREAATIREAHFRKRSSASCSAAGSGPRSARRMPVRPSGEKNSMSKSPSRRKRKTPSAPGEAFFQPAAAVSASTDSCKSDMLPPWGNYAVFHNALSIIKRGDPKRAAWGPSRTEAYPSGIRQAGGHNAPPVCREPRFPVVRHPSGPPRNALPLRASPRWPTAPPNMRSILPKADLAVRCSLP